MKELVIISGKGGTGKTSIVASFAALASNAVLADCDVDAADLHLLLTPTVLKREEFRSGHEAVIRPADCTGCGICLARCRFDAVLCDPEGRDSKPVFWIDPTACEGCGVCVTQCPVQAIDFVEQVCGEWLVSNTRHGPMVHARLKPGGENSGRLVSQVRATAQALAAEQGKELILTDGPPGVGCAVIASVSGATGVLVVTEPTLSGSHDLARVLELTRHFDVPTTVCVNKWDLNPEMAERIEAEAKSVGTESVGRVRYDSALTAAQLKGLAVVETDAGPVGDDVRRVWENVWAGLRR